MFLLFSKLHLATPFFLTFCPLFQRACHLERRHVHPRPVLRVAGPPADVQGRAGRRPGQERAPGSRVPRHGAGVPRVRAAPGHRPLVRTVEPSGRRFRGTVPRMSVATLLQTLEDIWEQINVQCLQAKTFCDSGFVREVISVRSKSYESF